ncbi:MAG TPA: hypothetical protein VFG01_10445 [Acidobacteriota bacterium]|nr:hypothetical protein [Acidobacteriota bacterium]
MTNKLDKKLKPGPKKRHHGYAFLTSGKVPKSRKYIEKYIGSVRDNLIKDLGPTQDDLTTAQMVLIDRVIMKLGFLRLIEEYIRETGEIFKGNTGKLLPCISNDYTRFAESVRRDLSTLGINKRAEAVIDPIKYIQGDSQDDDDNK